VGNAVYFLQDSLGEILEENGAMLEWVSEFLRGLGSRRAERPRKEARLHRFVCINFICWLCELCSSHLLIGRALNYVIHLAGKAVNDFALFCSYFSSRSSARYMDMVADEASVAKIDPNGDTILEVSCPDGERRLLVSSKVLTLASPGVRENVQLSIQRRTGQQPSNTSKAADPPARR